MGYAIQLSSKEEIGPALLLVITSGKEFGKNSTDRALDDNDTYPDVEDNCPLTANDQTDSDGDGAGDECDTDDDNDNVIHASDLCPGTATGEIVNADGCSVSDLCPCSHPGGEPPWRNHGAYVRCVAGTSESFVDQGLISEAQKDAIVSDAARSSCGK